MTLLNSTRSVILVYSFNGIIFILHKNVLHLYTVHFVQKVLSPPRSYRHAQAHSRELLAAWTVQRHIVTSTYIQNMHTPDVCSNVRLIPTSSQPSLTAGFFSHHSQSNKLWDNILQLLLQLQLQLQAVVV
jgi:hypothetical protein